MWFTEERTEGEVSPYIMLNTGGGGGVLYSPLLGQWPIPQTEVDPSSIEEVNEEQSDR